MEEIVEIILKEFEKREISVQSASFILDEVQRKLMSNSIVKIKADK